MLMSRDNSKTSNIKLCFSVTIDDVFSSFGSSFKNWICIIMQACQMKAVCFLRCICAKSGLSCPTPCDPKDRSPPGPSVHGILQAGILDWAASPPPRDLPRPRGQTCASCSSCMAGGAFTAEPLGRPLAFSGLEDK